MPFCTKCGKAVADTATFCANCGTRQATAAPPPLGTDFLANIPDRTAMIICYIPWVGWIPAIVVLASARFRQNRLVRFHAFQGLYLMVAWLLVHWVLTPMFAFGHAAGPLRGMTALFQMIVVIAWVFMIVKTSQGQSQRLPIVGELAERSVAEQL